ncbi:MAG: NAD(P)/FAD-dependent oxidoreductase [Parvibaculum sp.]|uniref:flavin-containing monooxygenase n=1 Tax=Parvibaculum sp. TaxID=2024848 RepID=UPI0028483205|nr:NAD(P)/FAD-dependent oxidoreductase [Parvibaculum sp.]MDR3498283.1 NAD(P)/FAD-dependent oxidoreductase [Parvibaculum sp.]
MAQAQTVARSATAPSVAILGAGVAGICTAIKLKQAGNTNFTIYEKAAEIGGTWRENTYPGCSCDVPLHMYQFSFDMRPDWVKKFVFAADIKAYLESVVDKYGLRPFIRFNTEIEEAHFDEPSGLWRLKSGASTFEANVLAAGTGQLHHPLYPNIPGRESFKGVSWHSAKWNHEYDIRGKKLAVIGTGASAIQFVPEIAKEAGDLTIYQRTPAWVAPRPQREFAPWEKSLYRAVPWLMNLQRYKIYWSGELLYWAFHNQGEKIKEGVKAEMELHVKDPAKRAALTPDYEPGCKRVLFANDWFPAMDRDNVHIVTRKITRIVEEGVETDDGKVEKFDAIVYGTGFDTTRFLGPMKVTGLAGRDIRDAWKGGAEAHLGMTVSGFPNFFMLYGPNTNLGHNSIIFMIECQANYIVQCVEKLRRDNLAYLDVKAEVQRASNQSVQDDNAKSVFASGGCTSWYKTAEGKVTNNWANYTFKYWWRTRRPNFAEFTLRSRSGNAHPEARGQGATVAAQ